MMLSSERYQAILERDEAKQETRGLAGMVVTLGKGPISA